MEVIQIPLENQQEPVASIRTRTYFVLDDHLDEELLRGALDRLIRDHWRKLGARLVYRRDGRQEYHLPQTFDEDYELFRWSSRKDAHQSISEVSPFLQASSGERKATEASLFPPVCEIDSFLRPSDWPFERREEPPNAPILFVHITHFSDATVVGTNCPHVVGDQFGLSNIMRAWLGLVEGKAPPPMTGHDEDVLAHLKPYSEYKKLGVSRKGKMRVRRPGERVFVALGLAPDMIRYPKEFSYTLFLPLSVVESLRERHSKTLEEKNGASPGLSNGDIVSAILFKFARMHCDKPKKVELQQAVNLRNRIPALSGPNAETFIHNALSLASARVTMDASTPISELAYLNRQLVKEALDEQEIDYTMAVAREMTRRRQPIHNCEPLEHSYAITNWSAAWRGLDFSAAVKVTEGKERTKPNLMVVGRSLMRSMVGIRFCSAVMCKTDEGYWCDYSGASASIKRVEEYLAKDPLLENL